ncbi:zinc ribbon domain-containing protein [Streptomyces iranensis]|uniref:zinc ribbon domain-containing protein n=1 Tax=Streptomyces iranensis TaxID=576784 RepID=UPI0039B739BA
MPGACHRASTVLDFASDRRQAITGGNGTAAGCVEDGSKPPHIRVRECEACGAVLDRDINAAVNVAKAAGLAVSACRAQVRPVLVPAQRGEAGTHRDGQPTVAGIPGHQAGERKSLAHLDGEPVHAHPRTGGGVRRR